MTYRYSHARIMMTYDDPEVGKIKKSIVTLLMAAMTVGLLAGCGNTGKEERKPPEAVAETAAETTAGGEDAGEAGDTELIVFAAASLTETLTELGDAYMAEHPGVNIVFNFDSSGTLKTQIQEGAACDIFISAGQLQMNQLDMEADPEVNTEGLDFVQEDTRFDILENKVALVVPEDNPAGIESYDDLKEKLESGAVLMAMGNADVPVGQYAREIFTNLDIMDQVEAMEINEGKNVTEVLAAVTQGSNEVGVVYATDAASVADQVEIIAEAPLSRRKQQSDIEIRICQSSVHWRMNDE